MSVPEGYRPPCQQSATPDDWFIEDDGKQYPDLQILTPAERDAALESVAHTDGDLAAAQEHAIAEAEAKKTKAQLVRRRHASDECHVNCYLRLQCLDKGLQPENLQYGIYGGYTAKQRREIVRVRDEKRSRRG